MAVVAYGTAINDALSDSRTTLADLVALHDHATAILQAQGDLKGALRRLSAEIKRRQGGARAESRGNRSKKKT